MLAISGHIMNGESAQQYVRRMMCQADRYIENMWIIPNRWPRGQLAFETRHMFDGAYIHHSESAEVRAKQTRTLVKYFNLRTQL